MNLRFLWAELCADRMDTFTPVVIGQLIDYGYEMQAQVHQRERELQELGYENERLHDRLIVLEDDLATALDS